MKITEKAQEILNRIVETFQSGAIPEAIAMTIIPPLDIPCAHWSLNNRIITFLFGTSDARGIRQWDEVGRYPKKGSKAIHILVPLIRKKTSEKDEEETERSLLYGFRAMPVFRVEDGIETGCQACFDVRREMPGRKNPGFACRHGRYPPCAALPQAIIVVFRAHGYYA